MYSLSKVPISFKAYDNVFKYPMGISLSIGVSLVLSSIFDNDKRFLIVGIICIVAFFAFKYLNYKTAQKEMQESLNDALLFMKEEVDKILNNKVLDDDAKIKNIIKLSEAGNKYATLFLNELVKQYQEEQ